MLEEEKMGRKRRSELQVHEIFPQSRISGVIILDCLTVWLGNLHHHLQDEKDRSQRVSDFFDRLGLEEFPDPPGRRLHHCRRHPRSTRHPNH